jgi:hypothetical protein
VNIVRKLDFNICCNAVLLLGALFILFHFLVLFQVIPYSIVWGGRLNSLSEMYIFEVVSVFINLLLLSVVAVKSKIINISIGARTINTIAFTFSGVFLLNTIGNIASKSIIETILFTPITLVLSVLYYRIGIEK